MAKKRKTELDIDIVPQEEKGGEVKKEEGAAEEAVKEPVSKKKLIIIISSAVAVILIVSVVLFFTSKKPEKKEEAEKKPPPVEVQSVPVYNLEPFLIPLTNKETDGSFLKVSMSVELSDKDLTREFERNIVFLRENIFFILKNKELKDFQDIKEKEKLTKDIISALNMGLQSGTVINLYFTEFIIM
jgi:flagellar FliL protein